jgi:2-polyprenyl-3-methyl-5-hydroxy-6-metoxy-1,4-benzoquinol methylase
MVSKETSLIIFSLLLFLLLLLPLKNGFTDDGFIHIQYADNLINRGEYSFNAGEVSFGTTSPLWVFVQAVFGWPFGGGEALVTTSRVFSWLCGFLSVFFVYVLARRLGGSRLTAAFAALAFASDAWLVRWTALSMETSAAVLACIWTGIASIDGFEKERTAWRLGFLIAITALIRPEAYLLFPVFIAAIVLRPGRVRKGCILRAVLIMAALLLPWFLFAKLHIGSFLPNTAAAKSGGWTIDINAYIRQIVALAKILGSTQGIPMIIWLLSILVLRRKSRFLTARFRFVLLWTLALPLAYVLLDFQILSRYMLLITPFIAVSGFLALEELLSQIKLRPLASGSVFSAVAAIIILVNAIFYFTIVVPPSKAFTYDLTHRLRSIAEHVRENSNPDAVVAARDIGYVAFYSKRRVMDLGGLVDPVLNALGEKYSYDEIVQGAHFLDIPEYPHVDFLIDMDKKEKRFEGRRAHGYRFESIMVERIDNLGIRKPGPWFYTLYSFWYLGTWARRHMMLRRFSEVDGELSLQPNVKILDIGSAWGFNVMALRQMGHDAVGMDLISDQFPSGQRIAASNNVDFPVIAGDAAEIPFTDEQFDCITMVETFEHIFETDRIRVIGECRRVLRPGGRLVLSTPNYRGIVERFKRFAVKRPGIRARMPSMCYPQEGTPRADYHPYRYHFPLEEQELHNLLENNGFRVIKVKRFLFVLKNTSNFLFPLFLVGEKVLERLPVINRGAATVCFVAER